MNLRQLPGTGVPTNALDRAPAARADGEAARAGTASAASCAVPVPAASVQVSAAAAAGSLTTAARLGESSASDAELIATLKARIAAGEFHIDYGSLARSLVEDALQAMGKQR